MLNHLSLYTEALMQTVRTVLLFTLRYYSKESEPCGTVFLFTLRRYSKQSEPCGTFPPTVRCYNIHSKPFGPVSFLHWGKTQSQSHLRNYSKQSQDHLELSHFYNKALHLYMLQHNCIPHKRDFPFVWTYMYLVCGDWLQAFKVFSCIYTIKRANLTNYISICKKLKTLFQVTSAHPFCQ